MMKNIKTILTILCTVVLVACEITDFGEEFQIDPDNLSPESADPNFLLNKVQLDLQDLLQDLNRTTDEVMRYTNLNDSYSEVADQSVLNGEWQTLYALLEDAAAIEDLAASDENLRFHRGASRILTAYAAEVDLNAGTPAPATDLYYKGDREKWLRLANSLQLKMLVNTGNQERIDTLIAEDNFIDSKEDDFQFNYSSQIDPLSQHPDFSDGYISGGQGTYMGNSFMNLLLNGKTMQDPRIRYYIFRQSSSDPTSEILRCVGDPLFDFCYLGNSYYGRDHGDVRPGSSDRELRAIYGLYPVGGAFDEDEPSFGVDAPNQQGVGILPILLSSFVDFLRAEAALSLNTSDDPRAFLESGIRKSMDKVLSFGEGVALGNDFAATDANVDAYVEEVLSNYATADTQGRLDIVLEEYYIASYGNSTESYNGYRRTGFPSSLQAPILNDGIPFPRTFAYPEDAINNNTSLTPRPLTTQVFWDTNPPGFIQ